MVLDAAAYPAVIEQPPILCTEIVSPDDKLADLLIRAGDYLALSVPVSWILDPGKKQAFVYSEQGTVQSPEAGLRHGQIELPVAELFEQL
jgi:Uma2 family endonuclease